MNSNLASKSMPEELLSKIHTGSLLDNLDAETLQKVLDEPCMKYPLVIATKPFARAIQETLMKCAYFDAGQGRFIRTKITRGRGKLGPMGHTDQDGYVGIMVAGYNFCQSQLVYLWLFGKTLLGGEQMDHINGDRANDYPGNLRLVSNIINHRNTKKYCTSSTGYTGVSLNKNTGRYVSQIMVSYK